MRAAAILGLGVTEGDIGRFRLPGVELIRVDRSSGFDGLDAALIFGGDGTVHHQLAALVKNRTPLLVVPTGSGNDFAAALGIRSRRQALDLWKAFCRGIVQPYDVDLGVVESIAATSGDAISDGLASELFFCNAGAAGLDAAANRSANRLPRWLRARGGYLFCALWTIALFRPARMKILLLDTAGNWTEWLNEASTLIAVANNSTYGDGIRIAPHARVADGKLDVCFVRGATRWGLFRLFPRAIRGRHLTAPLVQYLQTERLRIETDPPMDLYADGEFACQTPIEIRIQPGALRVIAASL